MLVEGPSEIVLFEKVLSIIEPLYESEGTCVLAVGGVGFIPYYSILKQLNIKTLIKTDNDLRRIKGKRKYSLLGFIRLNNLIDEKILPTESISKNSIEAKRELYDKNRESYCPAAQQFLFVCQLTSR